MQQTMRNHLNDTLPGFRIPGTSPVGKLQSMAKLRSRKIAGRETDSLQHIGRRRSDAGTCGNHIRAYQRGRRAQGFSKGFWRNGRFLKRRAPGRDSTSTPRKEGDEPEFLCGLVEGVTCGAPLAAVICNGDTRTP